MARTTPATQALDKAGADYTLHTYDYDSKAQKIGLQAADAIGMPASRVFKTLMAWVEDKPVCVLIPSDRETSMKKLAAAFGGKTARMMRPEEAEKLSGYRVGGISPLGQRRLIPAAVDDSALSFETIFINGGQRGLQAELRPAVLLAVLNAKALSLIAEI